MRGRGGIEILEEAIGVMRSLSAAGIALYLLGAAPFLAGLLFFMTDMLRDAFAAENLAVESLGLAVLFIWKNCWQAVFRASLYSQISGSRLARVNVWRLIAVQGALQPLKIIVMPISLLIALPLAWATAFFRNVGLLAALGEPETIATARKQASLWPRQNWIQLSIVTLAALILFANVLISIMLLPQIGRSFLGIEGDFAKLGIGLLNGTTVAVAMAITWLFIDPLLDAVYVLRCFYGQALATGEDLRVSLKYVTSLAALGLLVLGAAPQTRAQEPPADSPATVRSIDPEQLDRSIEDVIRRREFAWRAPRPEEAESESAIGGWLRSAWETISRMAHWAVDLLRRLFPDRQDVPAGPAEPKSRIPLEVYLGLAAVVILAAAVAIFLRRGRDAVAAITPTTPAATVDLANEDVTADQLSESSWMQLARDMLASGNTRLAMRALYLAGLNYLSECRLISIHRWKTGSDYRRELERRSAINIATEAAIVPIFARNVTMFEKAWYGFQSVEADEVHAFARGLEEIKQHVGRK